MGFPEKQFFSLEEVAERWRMTSKDVLYYGAVGQLEVSTLVVNQSVFPPNTNRESNIANTGPFTLDAEHLLLLLRDGALVVTADDDTNMAKLKWHVTSELNPTNSSCHKWRLTSDKLFVTREALDQFERDNSISPEKPSVAEIENSLPTESLRSVKYDNLLKTLAVTVRLFLENQPSGNYGSPDRPNVKEIVKLLQSFMEEHAIKSQGFGDSSLHERISTGLKLLNESEKSQEVKQPKKSQEVKQPKKSQAA